MSNVQCQMSNVKDRTALRKRLGIVWLFPDGSATPMRGKSATCRKAALRIWRSMTEEDGVGDREEKERLPASLKLAAHRRGRAIGSELWTYPIPR